MKNVLNIISLLLIYSISYSQINPNVVYSLPDSVKAVSFFSDIMVSRIEAKKESSVGIRTEVVKLFFESHRNKREIEFEFPSGSTVVATGIGVKAEKDELSWKYNWKENEYYKLMISTAGDSAGNFALYSGYVFLPKENKWKLIGTCKIHGQWNTLKQLASVYSKPKKTLLVTNVNEVWIQRSNGSWKSLNTSPDGHTPPVTNLYSHLDSIEQLQIDKKIINRAIAENKTDAKQEHDGVYYTMIKEGTGKQVSVNDTVTAFYKGYLFSDNSIFDQTKDKPAIFPLNRLIKGWQIGVPLCKVGGKIILVILSNLAYSIRTRAAKIPPNSILVFEIEVVDAKSPQ